MKSLMRGLFQATLLASVCLLTSTTNAAIYGFDCVTNNSASNCAVGESNLLVEVTAGPAANEVTFTFTNSDPSGSSIADVYFDDGSLLDLAVINSSSGVSFTQFAAPKSLPGGNAIDWNSSKDFSADSDAPVYHNGVNTPTEWLDITFTLQNGQDIDDVIAAIDLALANPGVDVEGGLRIGIHLQAIGSGGSESFANGPTVIPVPAAAWLFGSALLALSGLARRRR